MLLDPEAFELVPESPRVLEMLGGDNRFPPELPASQVESLTTPCRSVPEVMAQLVAGRRRLAEVTQGSFALAGAGVHPTSPVEGDLFPGSRYEGAIENYGAPVLSRQLVFAFQVHVAPGSADGALAVHNALRTYLPLLAGLAANGPFLDGEDTHLASVRPQISTLLPRQGVPPALASWDEFAEALEWGKADGVMVTESNWWWELRPRPKFGTLEIRVPDTQTTLPEAEPLAALVHCLVVRLAERHEAGERLPVHPTWKIAENRWVAARDGADAVLADLDRGGKRPLREQAEELAAELADIAATLGCERELAGLERLLAANGATRQREIARERGIEALPAWLAGRFLEGC